jgi:ATP-dependent Lhr-like helicase
MAWGRLWGSAATPIRTTPICIVPRDELHVWTSLSKPPEASALGGAARAIHGVLVTRGAMFPQELARASRLLPSELDAGLGELVARGLLTCDSFGGLRSLVIPPSRRRTRLPVAGRWSLLHHEEADGSPIEMVARQLLRRTGVVFRRTLLREKQPFPWRDLVRVLRTLEARGDVRGGRFVAGFDGEQYALPEAVSLLRAVRRRGPGQPLSVAAADPLNFRGILTPDERVSPLARQKVLVA